MDAIFNVFRTIVYAVLDFVAGIVKSILRNMFPDFNWDSTGGTLIAVILVLIIAGLCSFVLSIFAQTVFLKWPGKMGEWLNSPKPTRPI